MKWDNPSIFVLLGSLPIALVLFFVYTDRAKRKVLQLFCDRSRENILLAQVSKTRQILRMSLILVATFFILLALCQPQWGFHWEEVKRKGVDILIAVDVSKSMLATDIEPNRLERAKRELIDLLRLLQGDRIGLIAFAGVPYLECPLTLDYGVIPIFLDYLDTQLIPVPGTAIGDAIRLAGDVFARQGSQNKALILITDGEDHGGQPIEAAKEAKKAGIKIFPIGIGKEEGAPIPAEKGGGFRKDRQGNLILTKLDEKALQDIALETGGIYVRSVTGDLDLEKIYVEGIRRDMEQTELKSSRRQRFEERFQWPLGLAILLLLIEPLISERKRP